MYLVTGGVRALPGMGVSSLDAQAPVADVDLADILIAGRPARLQRRRGSRHPASRRWTGRRV